MIKNDAAPDVVFFKNEPLRCPPSRHRVTTAYLCTTYQVTYQAPRTMLTCGAKSYNITTLLRNIALFLYRSVLVQHIKRLLTVDLAYCGRPQKLFRVYETSFFDEMMVIWV